MTISVVIPVFNEEAFLEPCLKSLRQQTRPPDEIIIVDNNCSDASMAIARAYGVVVIKEVRQGIMPAVCAGMSASTGDIIARCDADSILPAGWIATIEKEFTKCSDVVGVTGPGSFYDTNAVNAALAQLWYMYAYFILVGSALANWPLFGSNCAIRRSLWVSIYPRLHSQCDDIHDDIELSMHIPPTSRVVLKHSLRVGISARALQGRSLPQRYQRGLKTLRLHWPAGAPWRRWRQVLLRINNTQPAGE